MINTFKGLTAAAVTVVVILTSGCGGGGGGPEPVLTATTNVNQAVTANNISAITDKTFTFSGGIPALGTTGTTTLSVTPAGTGTLPKFSVSSATDGVASGTVAFGSCIFRIDTSTSKNPKLAVGQTVEVTDCTLQAPTASKPVGAAFGSDLTLTLNGTSSKIPVTIVVNADGSVTVDGKGLGTVTVTLVTGT
ncbi:hypothetical protein ACFPOE_12610 [Caenimonas terrae]|uniref:Lipoprotein n=1 Tax=Caenimonas terrae TaxID=696074 RepID=A0ABW0NEQ0_9BURK